MKKIKSIIKEKVNERLFYKYPLFVCYPRSGTHWVNYLMELYFDRPRALSGGISPLDQSRKDYMWISSHDMDLKLLNKISKMKDYKFKKVLYLYRNSFEAVFSFIKFNVKNPDESPHFDYKTEKEGFSNKNVMKHFDHLHNHLQSYLDCKLVVPIKYDALKNEKTREKEFEKICNFFGEKFDSVKFNKVYNEIKDKNMSAWTGKRSNKKEKEEFKKKWGTIR